jgi:F0F1-type ATP synthase epsilon subunit
VAKKTLPTLSVIARAPFELYYEGPAEVLSAENRIGPFDVLPGHADFFSVLKPCTVIIAKPEGDPVSIVINHGILTVRDDQVMLFCNM